MPTLSVLTGLRQLLLSPLLFAQCMVERRRAVSLIPALACLFCLMTVVRAQDKQYTENKPDQALRSDARVDPSTLGMSLSVSFGGAPGRAGVSLPISLRYSSKQWRIKYAMSWQSYINYNTWTRAKFSENSVAGWTSSLEPPRIEFTGALQSFDEYGHPTSDDPDNQSSVYLYINRLHVHLSDGSSHELRKDDAPHAQYDPTGIFYAVDGSRTRYDADAGVLYLADGGRYFFGPDESVQGYQGQWISGRRATSYVDRNGNTLTYTASTRTWSDTLGRSVGNPLPANPTVGDQPYSVPGVNGNSVTYTLRWRLLADALSTPGDPLRYTSNRRCVSPNNYQALSPYLFDTSYPVHICADSQVFNPVVLAEVVLPTGQSYQYKYNVWGEIDKVISPGGGYERFRYDEVPTIGDYNYPYDQANRGVVEHWISPSGTGTEESTHRWQYSLVRNGNATATTTAPDGTRSERSLHASGPTYYGFDTPLAGMAYEERAYSATGQMLRRTLTKWWTVTPAGSGWPRDPYVDKTVSLMLDTGGNALASTTTMAYDADRNVIATSKYDYNASLSPSTARTISIDSIPNGALVRTDETSYVVSDTAIDAGVRQAYRDRNLVGLPSSTRVRNAAGTIVAQSEIKYDEAAYPLLTYGAVAGWTDPGTSVRANATTTRSWLDTTGAWLETHAQYDQAGNVRKASDAKGILSQVEYASAYHYAYPTHTISAVPDPSNQRGTNTPLESWTSYDFSTGKVTSTTDANSKTTSYQYNDVLNRLTRVDNPDDGWTDYFYGRNAYGDYVGTRTAINTTQNTEGYRFFDGLGRSVRSFQLDGSQWITSDTQYDAMGRVWRVSNPYLSGGSGTPINPAGLWTTSGYDALSRVTSVTTPDGTVITTSYGGNEVTVTDQAGKRRRSVKDALGRLSAVYEDPAGLNYQTSYTYDVLGNLRKVEQGGQMRFFMYDSLGRLVRAKSPEQTTNATLTTPPDPVTGNTQWSLSYVYDNNGKLSAKIDARGVTATYQYDQINRNTTVDYSDTPTVNPDVIRNYDGAVNGRGRFWYNYKVESQTWEHTAVDGYDSMGRIYQQRQHFNTNGVWSPAYYVTRSYDRMGHVTAQTYPSGRSAQYPQFDVAGRLKKFTGNLGDGVARTYATGINPANGIEEGIQYDEASRIKQEQFGTQTPLFHKQQFTVRGQLKDIRLGLGYDTWSTERGAVVIDYGTTANNGNVVSQQYWIPTDVSASAWEIRQTNYAYDGLNRLGGMQEFYGAAGMVGEQWFNYDRWGNRQINEAATTPGLNRTQFAIDAQMNRLGVPAGYGGVMQYDQAGNLTYDSHTPNTISGSRTYDAENRMTATYYTNNQFASGYTYDADGRRTRRKILGSEVWQVYGIEGELLAEYAAGAAPSSPQKEYGYRNGELLVTAEGAGQVNWLVSDHLGTPRMIADLSGSLAGIRRHDYLPFGEEIGAGVGGRTTGQGYSQFDGNRKKWAQLERDEETGLDYAQARYYSSVIGRFTSPDEFTGGPEELYYFVDDAANNPTFYATLTNPQSLNKYQYSYNNPLRYIDPTGHEPDDLLDQGQQQQQPPPPQPPPVNCLYCTPEERQRRMDEYRRWQQHHQNQREEQERREAYDFIPSPVPGGVPVPPGSPGAPLPKTTTSPRQADEHTSGARPSTEEKHEEGKARKKKDRGGEKGDKRRRHPRKPHDKHVGPWPPQPADPNKPEEPSRKNPCPECRKTIPRIKPKEMIKE
ncbi:MAG TPA: RHS repeat-associated core domain-containing protein [Pyrinomonadaceae bacterium]|nr:RHS repeat-associated core domain-containing protein [Pyrinomonadaceae bacterium]